MFCRRILTLAAVPVLLAGCASGVTEVASHPTSTPSTASMEPVGSQHTLSGRTYSSVAFIEGLSFTLPSAGWTLLEDDFNGNFAELGPPGHTDEVVHLFHGMNVTSADGSILAKAGGSVPAFVRALRRVPGVIVSAATTTPVGRGLQATTLDAAASAATGLMSSAGFVPQTYSLDKGRSARLFLILVRTPIGRDTLVVAAEAPTGPTFAAFAGTVGAALRTLTLPEGFSVVR